MAFDKEAFEERAAIMEFDGGLSRFRAETMAAEAQGTTRWRALGEITRGIVKEARDQREAVARQQRADGMPAMQPNAKKED